MIRFSECGDDVKEVLARVINDRFPSYGMLKFKLLFDHKKRASKGTIVLASIEVPSPKLRFLTIDDVAEEGYDYIVIIDKKAWDVASDVDKIRIVSHELRHVYIDEKGAAKTVGHEISDFYREIELNRDDPEWSRKLTNLVALMYEQEKDAEIDARDANGPVK